MEPIHGVSLEKYAELCALMANTGGDEAKEIAIAEANQVSGADWLSAKTEWTKRMSNPADGGKTAMAFLPLFQAAQSRLRGGAAPCTLEEYANLYGEVFFRKDKEKKAIIEELGYTEPQWLEFNAYWAEVVGQGDHPRYDRQKADIFGKIVDGKIKKYL